MDGHNTINQVHTIYFLASILAPRSNRALTICKWPLSLASIRAVDPAYFQCL